MKFLYIYSNQRVIKLRKIYNLIKIFICAAGYEFTLLVDI